MSGRFGVEHIAGKRIHEGKVEYLIKWQDHSETENTWEQEGNLNCYEKMFSFEVSEAPYKILAAENASGILLYLIESKQDGEHKFVSAKEFDSDYPHTAIHFYEQNLFWEDNEKVGINNK